MIPLDPAEDPKVSIVTEGLSRSIYKLRLRKQGSSEPLFSVTDSNYHDPDIRDQNPSLSIDTYSLKGPITGEAGELVGFDYRIQIGGTDPTSRYKVILAVSQGSATIFAKTFSHDDEGAPPSDEIRWIAGIEVFKIAEAKQ